MVSFFAFMEEKLGGVEAYVGCASDDELNVF